MPRKDKQKQKQKQKQQQKQTVVVNIGTRGKRTKRQARQTRQPPPTPQFMPYPVPNLRGPEPMVTPQPSLVQLMDALRPIQAPIVAQVPAGPSPIKTPEVIAEEKQEVGPLRVMEEFRPLISPDEPLISAEPFTQSSSSSSSSSSSALASSSSSTPDYPFVKYTQEQLEQMITSRRGPKTRPGQLSLQEVIQDQMGLTLPKGHPRDRQSLIKFILSKY